MKVSSTHRLRSSHELIGDLYLLAASGYFSYVLRLEKFDLGEAWLGCLLFVLMALIIVPLVFLRTGVYRCYWRYASVEELVLLAGSLTIAAGLTGGVSLLVSRLLLEGAVVPRSVPLIFLLLALVVTAVPRYLVRLAAAGIAGERTRRTTNDAESRPVLIMGAGDAGEMIARELQRNPHLGLKPVGFLDDDLGKHHARIHGVPVLGDRHAIPEVARRRHVDQVIIAMPTANGEAIRDIVRICREAGVRTRTIPGIYELLDGSVSIKRVRDVQIEDLLRREPIRTDTSAVQEMLRGKRVLVTGGGGSIGSELCRQILHFRPASLAVVGHGENSIFDIINELRADAAGLNPQSAPCIPIPVIADVRFSDRLAAVFEQVRPEIVFHAAAHKHVPLMESNEVEAVTNNVLGTRNLVEASIAAGVERFLMISTDKAVKPSSVMGATKRVAELIVENAARSTGRAFVAVRFGNVLGSRGSVVPFFRKQIDAGGPVTVTHPEMRRFFITIPEAVQLVLQAAVMGEGGEVFALDMGEPVRIVDLANDLIRLSGFEPGQDIQVVYTGPRPGEKLCEELFGQGEDHTRTRHEKIFVCGKCVQDSTPDDRREVSGRVETLIAAAERSDARAVRRLLRELVPEYRDMQDGASTSNAMPDSCAPLPEAVHSSMDTPTCAR